MEDRGFTEIDLRRMMDRATEYRADIVFGRFVISSNHAGASWDVIVEPDAEKEFLVVVTAYRLE